MYAIGIDCGATNLRIGLLDEQGNLLSSQITASPLKTSPNEFGKLSIELIKELLGKHALGQKDLAGVGVGVPGPLNLKTGEILASANLHNKEPIAIKKIIERLIDSKIYIDRDTNLSLLGEAWQGGARGFKDVVMLTLGSGVGGSVMVNGEIDRGSTGKAGEIGHIYIEIQSSKFKVQNLPRCGLGHQGCLEALINSASSLDELSTYLGYGLANIVDLFNPEKIIIGGGKINLGDFLPKAIEIMKQKGIKPAVDQTQVEYAKLKELSGIYGGAKLVYDNIKI